MTINITDSTGITWGQDLGGPYQINTTNMNTITLGSSVTGGYVYSTGTGAPSIAWGTESISPGMIDQTLRVKGDAEFESDITIKGKSLTKTLQSIEERLAILHPNPELEEKWGNLKELGKMYRELEQEIIEKEKMWAILKK